MVNTVTPRQLQREYKQLPPEARERVREQVQLRAMAARFMGQRYSKPLAAAVLSR